MAGLLEDYGMDIDFDSVPDGPDYSIEDGIYEFEIGDIFLKEGTDNYPDKRWIVIEYLLGTEGKKTSDWFQLPADQSDITDAEMTKLGFYKQRLDSLGVAPEKRNTVGRDELVGLTGVLVIKSSKSKKDGKVYQNIAKLTLGEVARAEQAAAPAAPATVAATKAPARAKAATAKAPAATTAVKNPFASKA